MRLVSSALVILLCALPLDAKALASTATVALLQAPPPPPGTTALQRAAASLRPGEWKDFPITGTSQAIGSCGSGSSSIGYSVSMAWDPNGRKGYFVGGDHNGSIRHITFDESTNSFSATLPPWQPVSTLTAPAAVGETVLQVDTTDGMGPGSMEVDLHTCYVQAASLTPTTITLASPLTKAYPVGTRLARIAQAHGYDGNVFDPVANVFYAKSLAPSPIRTYVPATGAYGTTPRLDSNRYQACCPGVAMMPWGLSVYDIGNGTVAHLGQSGWTYVTVPNSPPPSTAQALLKWVPQAKKAVLLAGTDVKTIDLQGNVVQKTSWPFPVGSNATGSGAGIVTVDPVTGKLLILRVNPNEFWQYDVATDTLTRLPDAPSGVYSTNTSVPLFSVVVMPISTHGILLFVTCSAGACSTKLYRHAAGGSASTGESTTESTGSTGPSTSLTWQQQCAKPGVIRCYDFNDPADLAKRVGNSDPAGVMPSQDCSMRSPLGNCTLRLQYKGKSGEGSGGYFSINFRDDMTQQLTEGGERWLKFSYRVAKGALCIPGVQEAFCRGQKAWILGEGDVPDPTSPGGVRQGRACSSLQIFGVNGAWLGNVPMIVHACPGYALYPPPIGGSSQLALFETTSSGDTNYQNGRAGGCLRSFVRAKSYGDCFRLLADKWMTIVVHVKVGTWYRNDVKVGTPTVTVAGNTATFSDAQPLPKAGCVAYAEYGTGANRAGMWIKGQSGATAAVTRYEGRSTAPPPATNVPVRWIGHLCRDSQVEVFAGYEGEPIRPVVSFKHWDLVNALPTDSGQTNPMIGKLWLLTHSTGKDASIDHPTVDYWWGDLTISSQGLL